MRDLDGNFHCISQEERQVFLWTLIKSELFFVEDSWVGTIYFTFFHLTRKIFFCSIIWFYLPAALSHITWENIGEIVLPFINAAKTLILKYI